jgi:hypothetical protein
MDITIHLVSPEPIEWPNKEKGHIYALSKNSVGITAIRNPAWEKQALVASNITVQKNNFALDLGIPKEMGVFYQIADGAVVRDWMSLSATSLVINVNDSNSLPPESALDRQIEQEGVFSTAL